MSTKRRKTTADELRAQLAEIEANAKSKRKKELTSRLAIVRSELRSGRSKFEKMAGKIALDQERLNAIHGNQMAVITALGSLQNGKPAVADFLPSDPEALAWAAQCNVLSARLEKLRCEKQALGSVEAQRIAAVELREHNRQLEYEESNIVSELQGVLAVNRVGGTFGLA